MINIQERIRHFQKIKGMNDSQLAKASKLNPSVICSAFTRCYEPTVTTLNAICNGLGITLSEFFEEEKEESTLEKVRQEFLRIVNNVPESKLQLLGQFLKEMVG